MFGEDFVKEPYQKQHNDDRIVKRKSMVVPFGWAKLAENPNYIVPVPKELEAIEKAVAYRDTGEYSWLELASWMHKITGRKLSPMGFKDIYRRAKEKENGSTRSITQETGEIEPKQESAPTG